MYFNFKDSYPAKLSQYKDENNPLMSFSIGNDLSLKYLTFKTSDYVPLCALQFPYSKNPDYYVDHHFSGYNYYRNEARDAVRRLTSYQENLTENRVISKYLYAVNRESYVLEDCQSDEFYEKLVNTEIENLTNRVHEVKKNLLSIDFNTSVQNVRNNYGRVSYKKLFNKVISGDPSSYYNCKHFSFQLDNLRTSSYLSNYGFCAKINWTNSRSPIFKFIKDIEVLFSYMVKVEMVPYVKMCLLLGEEPHPDSLELWVNDKLDVPKGEHKNIRPRYRKNVKNFAESRGIKIEESSDLNADIFKTYKLPTFKTMKKRKEWYNFISSGVINSLCHENQRYFKL
tara:strand:+ start:851 stop:1870 length:1020 start_codon:yes stop_codon:yes gene_type:complete